MLNVQDFDRIYALQALPISEREKLIEKAEFKQLKVNTYLFKEDEDADKVWIVMSGKVKIFKLENGQEKLIGVYEKEEAILDSLILQEDSYPYNALTLSECELYSFDKSEFSKVLNNPQIALSIISALSKKLHEANINNLLLSTRSPKAKVAGLLLYYRDHQNEEEVSLKLIDMAKKLNLRIETVSRKLKELKDEELISRCGNGRIKIEDYEGLSAIYQQN